MYIFPRSHSPPLTHAMQTQRYMGFCAYSETYPSNNNFFLFMQMHHLKEIRICSEIKVAQQRKKPQYIYLDSESWEGGVMILMHVGLRPGNTNIFGYNAKVWRKICESVGWMPADFQLRDDFERKRGMPFWRSFLEFYKNPEVAAVELEANVVKLEIRSAIGPRHMSPTTSSWVATRQLSKAKIDSLGAELECDRVERQAREVLQEEHVPPELVKTIKKKSVKAVRSLLDAREELATTNFFVNQPHSKSKRRMQDISLKSKKPEHVAKRLKALCADSSQPSQPLSQEPPLSQPASLSLQEMVVARELPQPVGDEWKYKVAVFLKNADQPRGAAASLLRSLLPQDLHAYALSKIKPKHSTRSSPGCIMPTSEASSDFFWPTRLETHRCLLLLEKAAETVLRVCVRAIPVRASSPTWAVSEEAYDLQVAWAFRGGLDGEGPTYWAHDFSQPLPQLPDLVLSRKLFSTLSELRSSRREAFTSHYPVYDEFTWVFPYLWKLYKIKCGLDKRSSAVAFSVSVKENWGKITDFRQAALHEDMVTLVRYGINLLRYVERLMEIARTLLGDDPNGLAVLRDPKAAMDYSTDVLYKLNHGRPLNPNKRKDVNAIHQRKDQENMDASVVLKDLGLEDSPLLRKVSAINDRMVEAMSVDSYQRSVTVYLHGSPSLRDTHYNPEMYLG